MLDKLALLLVVLGAVNYGCVGIFGLDLLSHILSDQPIAAGRILYTLVGASGLWCLPMLFNQRNRHIRQHASR